LAWNVELSATAEKQLRKLDRQWQAANLDYLEDEIAPLPDPRSKGKALVGDKKGLWRFRVADFRVICEVQETQLVILAVAIGHRKNVYES
jgi:mRNA interferase RelE/StbE